MLPVGPRFYNSPLYMREDPYWDKVVLAMHMDGDPYWANVTLSMPMDGADNGTVFTDLKGHTTAAIGNTVTRTINKAFGTASAYFDGTGDSMSIANSGLDFDATGDITIECWIYVTSLAANRYMFSINGLNGVNASMLGVVGTAGGISFGVPHASNPGGSATYANAPVGSVVLNQWYHIACVKQGLVLMLFVNGTLVASATMPENAAIGVANRTSYIGSYYSAAEGFFQGYIDNFRITKGVARYTTHFELSTSPFPIGTTFVDEKGHTVTANGNAVISTAQSRYSGYSAYFDGTGDYLNSPATADFDVGVISTSTYFTIEYWCNLPDVTTGGAIAYHAIPGSGGTGRGGWSTGISGTGAPYIDFAHNITGASNLFCFARATTFPMLSNTWHHIALVLNAGNILMFVDGKSIGWAPMLTNGYYQATPVGLDTTKTDWGIDVGRIPPDSLNSAGYYITGYIDDLRITKGVARYTSNFNPPPRFPSYVLSDPYTSSVVLDLPFDGAANSTTIIDNKGKTVTAVGNAKLSTTQARSGSTSCYFDGASDYLSVAVSADFNLAANNFTVEFWLYQPTAPTSTQMVVGVWDGTAQLNWGIFASTNNSIGMGYSTTGTYQAANDIGINNVTVTNTWQHFAFVRNGNVLTGYAGGQAFFTKSMTGHTIFYSGVVLKVGGNTNNQWLNGYVDGLRITNGVARYTSDFSPYHERVASLVTDPYASNVVLGLHFNKVVNSNNIIDVTGKTITAVGNAQLSATQARFGPTACYFDGSADYLSIAASTDFNFGTGNFTIEAWIHSTYIASNRQAIFAGGSSELTFFLSGAVLWVGTLYVADLLSSGSNTIVANTWQHVAVSRSGTTLRVFIDGILKNSVSNSNNFTYAGAPRVGATSFASAFDYFYGYIDDLRITKGIARYTANFTPPRAPFPNS